MATNIGVVEVGIDVRARQAITQLRQAQNQFQQTGQAAQQAANGVDDLQKSLVRIGAVVGAATFGLIKFGRAAFNAAADVSEMDVAMEAVNKSMALAPGSISRAAQAIKKKGIEMKSAQEIALIFAQGQLDMAKAADVARVAQDLAVMSQSNSTETARMLAYAIQTGNSRLLKSAGITRYAGEAYSEYAAQLGKAEAALTASERQTAVMNMILEEGAKVAGTYEAAMTEPGKVLRSFPRMLNEIQVAFGGILLEGFGPAIKAAYDLTKAFVYLFTEGGALKPTIDDLAAAFGDVMKPLTDFLKETTASLKQFNSLDMAVQGAGETFKKFLPIVGASATALSMFAGRNILNSIPILNRFTMLLGGPVVSALGVFIATNADARNAVTNLVSASMPAIEALATAMGALANAIVPVINSFASVASVITSLPGGAEALAAVIATLVIRKKMLVLANSNLGKAMKASIQNFQYMRAQVASANATFATAGKSASMMSLGFKAAAASAKALMSSILPLLALTAGLQLLFTLWDKFSNRNKAREEATKEFTAALRDQTNALLENAEALEEGVNASDEMAKALLKMGSEGTDLITLFGRLGVDAKDSVVDATVNFDQFAQKMLRSAGASQELASDLADVAASSGNLTEASRNAAAALGHLDENGRVLTRDMDAADTKLVNVTRTLTSLNNILDAVDFTDIVQEQAAWAVATKQVTAAQAEMAAQLTMAEWEAGLLRFGVEHLTNEQYDLIVAEKLLAIAAANATKEMENQKQVTALMGDLYPPTQKDIEAVTKAHWELIKAGDRTAWSVTRLTDRVELMHEVLGETATMDDFIIALSGTKIELTRVDAAMFQMVQRSNRFMDSITKMSGAQEDLVQSGYQLREMFLQNTLEMTNLGVSQWDLMASQAALIDSFIKTAEAAGYDREQIIQLIEQLGILDSMNPVIEIALEMNAEQLSAEIKRMQAELALLVQGAVGAGSTVEWGLAQSLYAELAALDAIASGFTTGGPGGGGTYRPGIFDGTSSGASEARNEVDLLAEAVYNLGESLVSQNFAKQLFGSTPEELVSIFESLTAQFTALGTQMTELGLDGTMITQIIENLGAQFTELMGKIEAAKEAQEAYNAAVSELQALESFREALVEQRDALSYTMTEYDENLQALEEGKKVYADAKQALERLTESYEGFERAIAGPTSELDLAYDALNTALTQYGEAERALDSLRAAQNQFLVGQGLAEPSGSPVQRQLAEELRTFEEMQLALADLEQQRAEYQRQVSDMFKPGLSPDSNVMGQTSRLLGQAREFRDNLIALRDRGFPPDILREVVNAGIAGGARLGRHLLRLSGTEMGEFLAMRDEIARIGAETSQVSADVLFGADIANANRELDAQRGLVQGLFTQAITEAEQLLETREAAARAAYQAAIEAQAAQAEADRVALEALYNTVITDIDEQIADQTALVDELEIALETANQQMADLVEAIQVSLFNSFNNFLAAIGGEITRLTTTPVPLSVNLNPTEQLNQIIEQLRQAGVSVSPTTPAPAPAPAPQPAPAPAPAPVEQTYTVGAEASRGGFAILRAIGVAQNARNMRKLWEHNGLWFNNTSWPDGHQTVHRGMILRIPAFAAGGQIRANQLSLIGENGPELFSPRTGGTIIPNHALGTGGGDTYNFTINTHAGMRPEDIVREIEKYTRRRGQVAIPTTGNRRF